MNPVSLDEQYRIFQETFFQNVPSENKDLLKLDYLYSQRTYRLPAFLLDKSGYPRKTWQKDRKTPITSFMHTIEISGSKAHLKSMEHPVYYAISHSNNGDGYFNRPVLNRIIEPGI